jgi:DHA3 family macrolide efflux protein-like MFS transporter
MGLAGPVGLAIAAPLGEAFGVRGVFIGGGVLSALVCLLALLSAAMWKLEKAAIEGQAPQSKLEPNRVD